MSQRTRPASRPGATIPCLLLGILSLPLVPLARAWLPSVRQSHPLRRVETAANPGQSEEKLSDRDEIRLGDALAVRYEKLRGLGHTRQTDSIESYLQEVGDKVAAGASRRLPYRFHFDPDPSFKSALSLPGGQVFVGGGLLSLMDREDELAVVLGHEIEHIVLGHCAGRILEEQAKRHLSSADLASIPVEVFFPTFAKDQELAADREGIRLAVQASYSPYGAIRLLEAVQRLDGPDAPSPDPRRLPLAERIGQVKDLIAREHWEDRTSERPLSLP